jgi:hypothetical protein
MRLFACGCCRELWHLLPDSRSRVAVEVAERFADGEATEDELRQTCHIAQGPFNESNQTELASAAYVAWCSADPIFANLGASQAAGRHFLPSTGAVRAAVLRDIIGNPFRPRPPRGRKAARLWGKELDSWLSWDDGTALKLAQAIYDDRAFDHLPILADALEEAGCTDPAILAHCRGPGPHVRGCWVVDLLLGKK